MLDKLPNNMDNMGRRGLLSFLTKQAIMSFTIKAVPKTISNATDRMMLKE